MTEDKKENSQKIVPAQVFDENNNDDDDEISLIDLCAVLIKHRKLIIIGTAIVTFIALVWLFIVPLLFPQFDKRLYNVEVSVSLPNIPPYLQDTFQQSIGTVLYQEVMRPQYMIKKVKQFSVFDEEINELDTLELNSFVQNKLFGKKLENNEKPLFLLSVDTAMSRSADTAIPRVVFTVRAADFSQASLFVESIIADMNEYLPTVFIPQLEKTLAETQMLLSKNALLLEKTATGDSTVYNNLLKIEEAAMQMLAKQGETSFLVQDDVFIVEEDISKGRLTKLIIVCFVSFFVFMFVAFMINAIQNVKQDAVAVKKITDAWKAGKK